MVNHHLGSRITAHGVHEASTGKADLRFSYLQSCTESLSLFSELVLDLLKVLKALLSQHLERLLAALVRAVFALLRALGPDRASALVSRWRRIKIVVAVSTSACAATAWSYQRAFARVTASETEVLSWCWTEETLS